ncbi:MAG TPA: HNH endonuclease [Bacteroidota bacterium]|nr:HNH endonuclease [Bacteroidota bacterium]
MSYPEEIVQAVWEKARSVDDNDAQVWRKDECGAWIQRAMYGDRSSQYGWEIDQLGSDTTEGIANLMPLQWRNRMGKGDGRLICSVTSNGIDNKEILEGDAIEKRQVR